MRIHRAPGRYFPSAYCAPDTPAIPKHKELSQEDQDRIAYGALERAYGDNRLKPAEKGDLDRVIALLPKQKRLRIWGLGPVWGRRAA
jgi:hypothetical protein